MKRLGFFVFMLLGMWGQAQGFEHYRALFWQQLRETCRPGLRLEKTVTEVDEDGGEKSETKVFELDCFGGWARTGGETYPLQPGEFSHLFEYAFDNPYYAPHLDVKHEVGVIATVKKGEEDKSKLRLQRFAIHPESGKLRFAEAHIIKDSPLYDLEVHIRVWFDAEGQYQRHEIETKTDVLLGGSLHTRIKAQLLP